MRQDEADNGTRADRLTIVEREELGHPAQRGACPAAGQRDPQGGERVFRPRTRPAPSEVSAFVDQNRERFGVEPICRDLEVSASAYWARRRRPPSSRAVRDEYLLGEIRRVHDEAFGIYGQFKVWQELNREGIPVARCTVERLMREHGIEGLRKGKTCRTTIPGPAPAPALDLVQRDFSAVRPDELWLADFTYIRTKEGWTYLAVVVDVYTRRIVGWQVAGHMRQSLVSDAFEMALAARQKHEDGLVAHSDNGAQYTSYEYTERLVRAGIAPSRGRTGTALDNAMAESVISTIKTELIKRQVWRTRFDLELALVVTIGWVQRASAAPRLQQAHAPRSARRVQSGGCPDNRGIHVIERGTRGGSVRDQWRVWAERTSETFIASQPTPSDLLTLSANQAMVNLSYEVA